MTRLQPDARRTRRTLLVMAAIALAPIVGSSIAYYFFPRDTQTNYGRLLATVPNGDITGSTLDGSAFRLSDLRGRWLLLIAAPGACDSNCERELYATRQARTMQGRHRDRIVRLWLVTDGATPRAALADLHPGIMIVHPSPGALDLLPAGERAIYLVDPLGNLVLQYPEDPDIKRLARDLARVLAASSIG